MPDALERLAVRHGGGFVKHCPDCQRLIVQGHDHVALDWPDEPYSDGTGAVWTLTRMVKIPFLGTRYVAARANPSTAMRAHRLHDHQPPDSFVRVGRFPWHRPGTRKTRSTQA